MEDCKAFIEMKRKYKESREYFTVDMTVFATASERITVEEVHREYDSHPGALNYVRYISNKPGDDYKPLLFVDKSSRYSSKPLISWFY